MRRLCRNCANCQIVNDETISPVPVHICQVNDKIIEADANPPTDGTPCEWRKRPKLSPEELLARRSEVARRLKRPGGRVLKMQMQINKSDHEILFAYAAKKGMSLVELVHFLCGRIVEQNPGLVAGDGATEGE